MSNNSHDLLVVSPNIGNIAVTSAKCVDYCCINFDVKKHDVINLLENSVFDDLGHTKKQVWIGGGKTGSTFFSTSLPFLAKIGSCPNFLN